ncbi:anti-repressor SinI family protein [Bacillus sp. B-jedd]|nr:anti-repressor SinI family protein [Bacillus sp. B-jedd]
MAIAERSCENLDQEWMALIMEAKEIGLGTDLVREFLKKNDQPALQIIAK